MLLSILFCGKNGLWSFVIGDGWFVTPRVYAEQILRPTHSLPHNDTVYRAAGNDIEFRTRAACGSVCNGLLCCRRARLIGEHVNCDCTDNCDCNTEQHDNVRHPTPGCGSH